MMEELDVIISSAECGAALATAEGMRELAMMFGDIRQRVAKLKIRTRAEHGRQFPHAGGFFTEALRRTYESTPHQSFKAVGLGCLPSNSRQADARAQAHGADVPFMLHMATLDLLPSALVQTKSLSLPVRPPVPGEPPPPSVQVMAKLHFNGYLRLADAYGETLAESVPGVPWAQAAGV